MSPPGRPKPAGPLGHVPMKRTVEAEEPVGPVPLLCSSHTWHVTAAILPVDGGYIAG